MQDGRIEYFEVTVKNLNYSIKSLVLIDDHWQTITKIGFDNINYEIVSNGIEHHSMIAKLFNEYQLILKFHNGILMKWNEYR